MIRFITTQYRLFFESKNRETVQQTLKVNLSNKGIFTTIFVDYLYGRMPFSGQRSQQ